MAGHGSKVLDVGCWDGFLSRLLMQRYRHVKGVDVSERAVELALNNGVDAQLIQPEGDLPFPDEYFDTVVAGEVIEHVLDTDGFLEELKRVLKPKGTLIITTPNVASLGRRLLLLLGKNPLLEVSLDGEAAGHLRYFTKDSLMALLSKHGFVIEEYCSDVVNFSNDGRYHSAKLARVFPTLGA